MRIKQAEEQAYKDAAAEAMHKAMLAELAEKEQFAETEDDIRRKSYVGLKLHKAFPSSTVGSGAAPTPVVAVRFCPDNDNLFAVATADKVCIYSADPPRLLQTAKAHADGGISDIDWAPAPGQEGLVGGSVGTAGGSGAASARDQAPAAAASNAQAASAPSAGSAASVAPGVSAALPSYSARLMTTGFDASVVVWLFSLHDRGGTPTASLQRRSELGCRVPVTHGRICKWNTSLAVIATCKAGFKFGNRIVKGELRLYNTERRFLCDSASHNTLISAITFDDTGRVVFVATMSGNVHAYVLSGDDSGRIGGVWLTKHQVLLASSGSSLFSAPAAGRALQAVRNLVVASCPLTNCVVAGAESRTVLVYDPSAGKNGAGQGGPGWQDDVGKMLDMLSAEGEKGPPRADAASQKRSTRIISELAGHHGPVVALCWSPRERFLVSGDDQGDIRIWSAAQSALLAPPAEEAMETVARPTAVPEVRPDVPDLPDLPDFFSSGVDGAPQEPVDFSDEESDGASTARTHRTSSVMLEGKGNRQDDSDEVEDDELDAAEGGEQETARSAKEGDDREFL